MASPLRTALSRGVLRGLAASASVGALILFVLSMRTLFGVDCSSGSNEECTFAHQIAGEIARVQGLAALGLALVGAGLAVFARGRSPAPP